MENTFGFQAQCQIREPYGRLESSIPLGLGLLTWNGQMARAKDGIVFLQVVRSKRLGPGDFHNFPVPRPCRIHLVEETIQAGPPVMNPLPCCCCCKNSPPNGSGLIEAKTEGQYAVGTLAPPMLPPVFVSP